MLPDLSDQYGILANQMQTVFATPGMMSALGTILVLNALSLLLMLLNIQIFRSQNEKYRLFLVRLGGQAAWGRPGRWIVPAYVLTACGSVAVTTALFLFQPHIL